MRTATFILVLAITCGTIFAFPQNTDEDQTSSSSDDTSESSTEEETTTGSAGDVMGDSNPLGNQVYSLGNSTSIGNQINSSSTENQTDTDYLESDKLQRTEMGHNSLAKEINDKSVIISTFVKKLLNSISNVTRQQLQKIRPFFQWLKSSLNGVHVGLSFDDVDKKISLGGQVKKEIFQNKKQDLHFTAHAAVSRVFGDPSNDSIKPEVGILIN